MEIKAKDLMEKHKIPFGMALRLKMLGDEILIEEAVREYNEKGVWQGGGNLWKKPELPDEVEG